MKAAKPQTNPPFDRACLSRQYTTYYLKMIFEKLLKTKAPRWLSWLLGVQLLGLSSVSASTLRSLLENSLPLPPPINKVIIKKSYNKSFLATGTSHWLSAISLNSLEYSYFHVVLAQSSRSMQLNATL